MSDDERTQTRKTRARIAAGLLEYTAPRVVVLGRIGLSIEIAALGLLVPHHLQPDTPGRPPNAVVVCEELHTWAHCLVAGCPGEHLREAREHAGIALRAAAACCVSKISIAQLEAFEDNRGRPTAVELINLSKVYDVRPDYLSAYPLVVTDEAMARVRHRRNPGGPPGPAALERIRHLYTMVGGVPRSTLRPLTAVTHSSCSCRGT